MSDLRKSMDDSPELRPYIEPFLSFMPVVELRALARAMQEGQTIGIDQQLAAISAAVPALMAVFANLRNTLQNPIPEGIDPDNLAPEVHQAIKDMTVPLQQFTAPLQTMEEIQQHLVVGDELAAATAHDPLAGLFAGAVWDSSMGALGVRAMEEFTQLDKVAPQMVGIFTPLYEVGIRAANSEVTTARESSSRPESTSLTQHETPSSPKRRLGVMSVSTGGHADLGLSAAQLAQPDQRAWPEDSPLAPVSWGEQQPGRPGLEQHEEAGRRTGRQMPDTPHLVLIAPEGVATRACSWWAAWWSSSSSTPGGPTGATRRSRPRCVRVRRPPRPAADA
jgi:hypothetical protein